MTGLTDSAAAAATHSWLYRWLTAEPEQEVIVIDLRETLTVAPFVLTVNRSLELVLPARAHSLLVRMATRVARLIRASPVRVAGGLLLVAVLASLPAVVFFQVLSLLMVALYLVAVLTGLAGLRVRVSWRELREARIVRMVAAAFEPPQPPEGRG